MPASAAERKRRSRAQNPETRTDEKDKNRERMAIYRAKNRAAKRAAELKLTLDNDEKKNVESKAIAHRRLLICDWFNSHKVMMPTDAMNNKIILNRFMPRIDLHQIEHTAAQFEIALAKKIRAKEPTTTTTTTTTTPDATGAKNSSDNIPAVETPEEAERRKTRNRISKRRSRANNPDTWSDEKEKSRARMYIYRASKKSQRRALELHRTLSEEHSRDVSARAADRKRRLIREWFVSRPELRVSPDVALADRKILEHIVPKLDMHKIEYKAAEFEISLAQEAVRARVVLPADGLVDNELPTTTTMPTTPEPLGNKGVVHLPEGRSVLLSPRAQTNSHGSNSTSAQAQREQDPIPKNDESERGNTTTKEERRKSRSGDAIITSPEAVEDRDVTKDEKNTRLQYPWQCAIATLLDAAERMETEEENSSSGDGGQ
mmetsp:Transcript_29480/g.63489  ORF Transcript_29480/g.63489 Transcript_29480/m.63489 type:complete len:432 (+) Transcript_29480:144-1439(+)